MKPDNELPNPNEIAELVADAVSTLDGLQARVCAAFEPGPEPAWTGWVSMGGGFAGALTLSCPKRLVERFASAMLALEPEASTDDTDDEVREAFAEFTHILAGNIKSLITLPAGSEGCALLHSKVLDGVCDVPGARSRREVYFTCDGDKFVVKLWESEALTNLPARQRA
jgi:hypothetical protein